MMIQLYGIGLFLIRIGISNWIDLGWLYLRVSDDQNVIENR